MTSQFNNTAIGGNTITAPTVVPYIGDPTGYPGDLTAGTINWPTSWSNYCYVYPPLSYTTYTDKTEKALAVAKMLRKDKIIKTESIDKFLEIVENIKAHL